MSNGGDLIETNNVWMTERLHDLYFTKDLLEVVDVQLRLVNDLDRHLTTDNRTYNIKLTMTNNRNVSGIPAPAHWTGNEQFCRPCISRKA